MEWVAISFMTLEQQVTTLETSKTLEKLGVKQKSLYYWIEPKTIKSYIGSDEQRKLTINGDTCSAFTVAELGELLPEHTQSYKIGAGGFACQYRPAYKKRIHETADTEAEVRGRMLIYLLENKLIEL